MGDPREMLNKWVFPSNDSLSLMLRPSGLHLYRHLDLPLLISWLSARQYAPEGGFAGRTNKLVDACYSHWVGGCWPLVEAALRDGQASRDKVKEGPMSLYSREGLMRYILCCCQDKRGGLRDKPGK